MLNKVLDDPSTIIDHMQRTIVMSRVICLQLKSLIIISRKLCIVRDVMIEKKTTSKQTHPTVDMVIKDHQKPAPAPLKNVLGKCSGFAFES